MGDDLRSLVEETRALVMENNKILHSMQRRARWGTAWKLFYWIVIVGISIGAFYFVQPYIKGVTDFYDSARQTQNKLEDMKSNFTNFFKKDSATSTKP